MNKYNFLSKSALTLTLGFCLTVPSYSSDRVDDVRASSSVKFEQDLAYSYAARVQKAREAMIYGSVIPESLNLLGEEEQCQARVILDPCFVSGGVNAITDIFKACMAIKDFEIDSIKGIISLLKSEREDQRVNLVRSIRMLLKNLDSQEKEVYIRALAETDSYRGVPSAFRHLTVDIVKAQSHWLSRRNSYFVASNHAVPDLSRAHFKLIHTVLGILEAEFPRSRESLAKCISSYITGSENRVNSALEFVQVLRQYQSLSMRAPSALKNAPSHRFVTYSGNFRGESFENLLGKSAGTVNSNIAARNSGFRSALMPYETEGWLRSLTHEALDSCYDAERDSATLRNIRAVMKRLRDAQGDSGATLDDIL